MGSSFKSHYFPSANNHTGIIPGKFIIVCLAGLALSVLALCISQLPLSSSLAISFGGFVSTLFAFRWYWYNPYEWETYIISIRPIFQTIMYVTIILAPLTAIAGIPLWASNPGSLHYYPLVYLVSPLIFLSYNFGYANGLGRFPYLLRIPSVGDIHASSIFIIFINSTIILGLFLFFSRKYGILASGGFNLPEIRMDSQVLKGLYFLYDGLLAMTIASIIIDYSRRALVIKGLYLSLLLMFCLFLLLLGSRTKLIIMIICGLLALQIIGNKPLKTIAIIALIIIPSLYFGTTTIRLSTLSPYIIERDTNVTDRIQLSMRSFQDKENIERAAERANTDFTYRMNHMEFPAAILMQHLEYGIPFMWGEDNFWGVYQAIPEQFIPFPKEDPEDAACNHFSLETFDQASSILSSAVADGGILGIPLVFWIVGFFHGILWRNVASRQKNATLIYLLFALIPELLRTEEPLGSYIAVTGRHAILYWLYIRALLTINNLRMMLLK